jgi:serine/threonine protein kinase
MSGKSERVDAILGFNDDPNLQPVVDDDDEPQGRILDFDAQDLPQLQPVVAAVNQRVGDRREAPHQSADYELQRDAQRVRLDLLRDPNEQQQGPAVDAAGVANAAAEAIQAQIPLVPPILPPINPPQPSIFQQPADEYANGPPDLTTLEAFRSFEEAALPPPASNRFWVFIFIDRQIVADQNQRIGEIPVVRDLYTVLMPRLSKDGFPIQAVRVFELGATGFPDAFSRVDDDVYELWLGGGFFLGSDVYPNLGSLRQDVLPDFDTFTSTYAFDAASLHNALNDSTVRLGRLLNDEGSLDFMVQIFFNSYRGIDALCRVVNDALQKHDKKAIVVFVDLFDNGGLNEILKKETWIPILPAVKVYRWHEKYKAYGLVTKTAGNDKRVISTALSESSDSSITKDFVDRRPLFGSISSTAAAPTVVPRTVSNRLALVERLFTIDANKLFAEPSRSTRLGAGGFGSVHRGSLLGLEVAVKFLKSANESVRDTYELFNEAHALGQLRHPNIVQLMGCCYKKQRMCIVQELCSRSLHDFTQTRQSFDDVMRALRHTALALAYIHERGYVHYDLKPPNLLYINDSRTTKLADVGLIRLYDSGEGKVDHSAFDIGTEGWQAPEVVAAIYARSYPTQQTTTAIQTNAFTSSPAVDIFAFGVIAYCFTYGGGPHSSMRSLSQIVLTLWCEHLNVDARLIETMKRRHVSKTDPIKRALASAIYTTLIMRDEHLMTHTYTNVGKPQSAQPDVTAAAQQMEASTLTLFEPHGDTARRFVFSQVIRPCLEFTPLLRPSAMGVLDLLDLAEGFAETNDAKNVWNAAIQPPVAAAAAAAAVALPPVLPPIANVPPLPAGLHLQGPADDGYAADAE